MIHKTFMNFIIVIALGLSAMLWSSDQAQTATNSSQGQGQSESLADKDVTTTLPGRADMFSAEGRQFTPGSAEDHFKRGNNYFDQKRYKEAISEYSKTLNLDPKFYVANYNRGLAYLHLRKYEQAIADFNNYLRHPSPHPSVLLLRGVSYTRKGEFEQALADYRRYRGVASPEESNKYNLHQIIKSLEAKVGAGRKEAPIEGGSQYEQGLKFGRAGDYAKAAEAFHQAIRQNPNDAKAYMNLGLTYGKMGRHREASEAFQQAIRLKPDYAQAYNNLGVAYLKLDRLKEAAEAFQQAIRLQPDYVQAQQNLKVAQKKLSGQASASDNEGRVAKGKEMGPVDDNIKSYEGKVIKSVMEVSAISGPVSRDDSSMTVTLKEYPGLLFTIKAPIIKELFSTGKIPRDGLENKTVIITCTKPKGAGKFLEVIDIIVKR
jgi:tetratricopeptide (TPR) repeat protein